MKIAKAISDKFAIDVNSIYLTHPTFISRIDNTTAQTIHDEYWHPHVDKVRISSVESEFCLLKRFILFNNQFYINFRF